MGTNEKQRTMFLLSILNPADHGYSIEYVESILQTQFKGLKYYCISYEHAPSTGTPHLHLFFMCNKTRWDTVRKRFPNAHLEPEVRGTPTQVRDYISKESETLPDDKKKSLDKFIEWGILPEVNSFDKENLLEEAQKMIDNGMKPSAIFSASILFRKYESIIRRQYFAKRYDETPPKRDVKFYYHFGASGSGKSYTYTQLCEQYPDDVFIGTDYTSNAYSLFDNYMGEHIVILDEVKPTSIPYGMLLNLTDCYRIQIHCRYSNAFALYDSIHLTSVFAPENLYKNMVDSTDTNVDTVKQLMRRITKVIYHFKDDTGFHTYEMDGSDYIDSTDIIKKAHGYSDGFIPLDAQKKETPFDTHTDAAEPQQASMPFD